MDLITYDMLMESHPGTIIIFGEIRHCYYIKVKKDQWGVVRTLEIDTSVHYTTESIFGNYLKGDMETRSSLGAVWLH